MIVCAHGCADSVDVAYRDDIYVTSKAGLMDAAFEFAVSVVRFVAPGVIYPGPCPAASAVARFQSKGGLRRITRARRLSNGR